MWEKLDFKFCDFGLSTLIKCVSTLIYTLEREVPRPFFYRWHGAMSEIVHLRLLLEDDLLILFFQFGPLVSSLCLQQRSTREVQIAVREERRRAQSYHQFSISTPSAYPTNVQHMGGQCILTTALSGTGSASKHIALNLWNHPIMRHGAVKLQLLELKRTLESQVHSRASTPPCL